MWFGKEYLDKEFSDSDYKLVRRRRIDFILHVLCKAHATNMRAPDGKGGGPNNRTRWAIYSTTWPLKGKMDTHNQTGKAAEVKEADQAFPRGPITPAPF